MVRNRLCLVIYLWVALSWVGTSLSLALTPEELELHQQASRSNLGALDRVQILLDAGVNVHAQDDRGETALHKASALGTAEVVQALLDAKADPLLENQSGQSAVILAASFDREEILRVFHTRGYDVHAPSSLTQLSSLHEAAQRGSLKALQALVSLGANLWHVDQTGRNALDLARLRHRLEAEAFLLHLWSLAEPLSLGEKELPLLCSTVELHPESKGTGSRHFVDYFVFPSRIIKRVRLGTSEATYSVLKFEIPAAVVESIQHLELDPAMAWSESTPFSPVMHERVVVFGKNTEGAVTEVELAQSMLSTEGKSRFVIKDTEAVRWILKRVIAWIPR